MLYRQRGVRGVSELDRLKDIVTNDIDREFLEALSIAVGWEYYSLYEELASNRGLTDELRDEEFGRRRGFCVARALAATATRFKVPVEQRRLNYNGQHKTIAQAGRVLIIQESIVGLLDRPKVADYKRSLAEVHGAVRQLELDLGDKPYAVSDWSGCVLCVLLHGAAGPRFTQPHRMLGGLFLAVPDASYSQWVLRLDLHRLAMFGSEKPEVAEPAAAEGNQPDLVVVTRKKHRKRTA